MEAKEAKETIADIIDEIRRLSNTISDGIIAINGKVLASRIDAAWKRECGNVAAMREALAKIWDKQWSILPKNKSEDETLSEIITLIEEALFAPPRNCDVGTEQEQHRRFQTFCNAHIDCVDCPIKAYWTKALSCGILWGQMPYEAEEGDGK